MAEDDVRLALDRDARFAQPLDGRVDVVDRQVDERGRRAAVKELRALIHEEEEAIEDPE